MHRRKLLLETFEDRILCSATVPVDAGMELAKDTQAVTSFSENTAGSDAVVPPDGGAASGAVAATAPESVTAQPVAAEWREVVFVDTGVENYQQLVDDLLAQKAAGTQFEVVLLDAERDGIAQISEALAGREDIDAIHFVTHGTDRAR